jgi:hypothetical protein
MVLLGGFLPGWRDPHYRNYRLGFQGERPGKRLRMFLAIKVCKNIPRNSSAMKFLRNHRLLSAADRGGNHQKNLKVQPGRGKCPEIASKKQARLIRRRSRK